ncbi:MFS transporter [Pseudonocardia halophobica]|uniref:Putative proline/betaine transporter n=1 Tax=Pseudonocardia halophobica TaxID=29401 RepID=A0A9W6NUH4_9PSEU|nr:MFS transporter [Pseudonocardia halophobica]GLL09794.1 MFS transporter [Pseudonocardia halophobica]
MAEVDTEGAAVPAVRRAARRVAVASIVGTTMEFYDFTIYGLASALVFGDVFFPAVSPSVGVLSSFATFGVGFLARPLGGILFGHLGDRIGRKKVLVATLLMMGGATVLIGCLPSFGTIGFWAPTLLVLLRLAQGLAYGGEWGGAVLMSFEHVPPQRRGFFASLPQTGLSAGSILGNLAFLLVALLPDPQLQSWGWRIPFWLGAVLVVIGLVVRRRVEESPEFRRTVEADDVPAAPLRAVIRSHPRQILLAAGVMAGISVGTYVTITYSISFAGGLGVEHWKVLLAILVSNVLQLVMVPLAGALSDRYGRRAVFLTGIAVWALLSLGFLPAVSTGLLPVVLVAYLVPYGIGYALTQGPTPAMFAEAFDSRVGYSGISLGFQLGNLVGGFAPFLAALVYEAVGEAVLGVCVCVLLLLAGVSASALVRLAPAAR